MIARRRRRARVRSVSFRTLFWLQHMEATFQAVHEGRVPMLEALRRHRWLSLRREKRTRLATAALGVWPSKGRF